MTKYIPPVTGVGGGASNIAANLFDDSAYFSQRPRAGTGAKRKRHEPGTEFYDITKDAETPSFPPKLTLDVASIRELLLVASNLVPGVKSLMENPKASKEGIKTFADITIALYNVIETLIEKAIIPLSETPSNKPNSVQPPEIPAGTRELREALLTAETTAIMFDAELGPLPLANRERLSANLNVGLQNHAVARANVKKEDPVDAVRVAGDALSLASDMIFIGQASAPPPPQQ